MSKVKTYNYFYGCEIKVYLTKKNQHLEWANFFYENYAQQRQNYNQNSLANMMQVSVKIYQALVLLAAGRDRNISDQLTLFFFSPSLVTR